jgi:hypothetical protein
MAPAPTTDIIVSISKVSIFSPESLAVVSHQPQPGLMVPGVRGFVTGCQLIRLSGCARISRRGKCGGKLRRTEGECIGPHKWRRVKITVASRLEWRAIFDGRECPAGASE